MVYRGWAIVAFVDLLGFSARLRETWHDKKHGALEALLAIKSAVEISKDIAVRIDGTEIISCGKVGLYSDSIVIFAPVPPPHGAVSVLAGLAAAYSKILTAMTKSAEHGFGVRGGIELGEVYWNGSEAIGPAFLDAYALETKASSARIAAGPALLRALATQNIDPTAGALIAQIFYRNKDEIWSIRAPYTDKVLFESLQDASPAFKDRYNELIDNVLTEDATVKLIRPNHLLRAAAAAETLMRQK